MKTTTIALATVALLAASAVPASAQDSLARTFPYLVDVRLEGALGIYDPADYAGPNSCAGLLGLRPTAATGRFYYDNLRTHSNLPHGTSASTPEVTTNADCPEPVNTPATTGNKAGAAPWHATYEQATTLGVLLADNLVANPATATWKVGRCVKEGSVVPGAIGAPETGVGASAFFPNSCAKIVDASNLIATFATASYGTGFDSFALWNVIDPGQSAVIVSCSKASALDTNTFLTVAIASHDFFTVAAPGNTAYVQWGTDPNHQYDLSGDNGCPAGF